MTSSSLSLVSHWQHFVDGLEYSPLTFYQYLKGVIESRELQGVHIDMTQFAERSMLSGRRKYLRVKRGKLTYYICGAPYGQGFFVSSWLIEKQPLFKRILLKIPLFGEALANLFYPITFYKIDVTNMFLTVIHDAIVSTTNYISEEGGKRPIPEAATKATTRNLFKR